MKKIGIIALGFVLAVLAWVWIGQKEEPFRPSTSTLPIPATEWQGANIDSVCLKVKQTYPESLGDFSLPIEEAVERILDLAGVALVTEGSECTTDLYIEFDATPISEIYYPGGGQWAGARIEGSVGLTAAGFPPIRKQFQVVRTPPRQVMVDQTVKPSKSAPIGDKWGGLWLTGLMVGLERVWGPELLLRQLGWRSRFYVSREAASALALTFSDVPTLAHYLRAVRYSDAHYEQSLALSVGATEQSVSAIIGQARSEGYLRDGRRLELTDKGLQYVEQYFPDEYQAYGPFWALGEKLVPDEMPSVIPALIGILELDPQLRYESGEAGRWYDSDEAGSAAVHVLVGFGRDAVLLVLPYLRHDDSRIRIRVMTVLREIAQRWMRPAPVRWQESQQVIPALIQLLSDKDKNVQGSAANVLRTFSEENNRFKNFGVDPEAWRRWWETEQGK